MVNRPTGIPRTGTAILVPPGGKGIHWCKNFKFNRNSGCNPAGHARRATATFRNCRLSASETSILRLRKDTAMPKSRRLILLLVLEELSITFHYHNML